MVEWRDLARAVERERIELFVMFDPRWMKGRGKLKRRGTWRGTAWKDSGRVRSRGRRRVPQELIFLW
jgi:hypothetical protein